METLLTTLVVDDSILMRLLAIRALKRIQGIRWNFIEASNGLEALNLSTKFPIQLGFIDWKMPSMGGVEVIQQLRLLHGKITPLILLTGEKTVAKIHHSLRESGADGYLCKPFAEAEVATKICPIISDFLHRRMKSRSFFARLLG